MSEGKTSTEYTRLGTSGLVVSRLALGCLSFGDRSAGRMTWILLPSDHATVDAVERGATDRGVATATVAMAWVLRNPVVDAAIIAATRGKHITRSRRSTSSSPTAR